MARTKAAADLSEEEIGRRISAIVERVRAAEKSMTPEQAALLKEARDAASEYAAVVNMLRRENGRLRDELAVRKLFYPPPGTVTEP